MHCCSEDGLPTDPIHVDARATLQVVEMDVAKLCDEVRYPKPFADLRITLEVNDIHGNSNGTRDRCIHWVVNTVNREHPFLELTTYLHSNREIGTGFGREKQVDRLFLERLIVRRRGTHFDDMELNNNH